jgi:hypothetical protein
VANQILLHPFIYREQEETLRYCAQHDIKIIAYPRCPWSKATATALDEIADRHGRTKVQIMLRWAVDHGYAVIPLSTNQDHINDNFAIRDFHLLPSEVETLNGLQIRYSIDELNADNIQGWAFSSNGLERIQVLVDGVLVGDAVHGRPRPDVTASFPDEPAARDAGFVFQFPDLGSKKTTSKVSIVFQSSNGMRIESEKTIVDFKS